MRRKPGYESDKLFRTDYGNKAFWNVPRRCYGSQRKVIMGFGHDSKGESAR